MGDSLPIVCPPSGLNCAQRSQTTWPGRAQETVMEGMCNIKIIQILQEDNHHRFQICYTYSQILCFPVFWLWKGGTMVTITKSDLIALGYGPSFAADIIRETKKLMISRGHTYYQSRKLDRVPKEAVEELLGITIPDKQN